MTHLPKSDYWWTGDGGLAEESGVDPLLQLPNELGVTSLKKKRKVILCEIPQKNLLLLQMQMEKPVFIWSGFYLPFGRKRKTFVLSYTLASESAVDATCPHGPYHFSTPVSLALGDFSRQPHLLAQVTGQPWPGVHAL